MHWTRKLYQQRNSRQLVNEILKLISRLELWQKVQMGPRPHALPVRVWWWYHIPAEPLSHRPMKLSGLICYFLHDWLRILSKLVGGQRMETLGRSISAFQAYLTLNCAKFSFKMNSGGAPLFKLMSTLRYNMRIWLSWIHGFLSIFCSRFWFVKGDAGATIVRVFYQSRKNHHVLLNKVPEPEMSKWPTSNKMVEEIRWKRMASAKLVATYWNRKTFACQKNVN